MSLVRLTIACEPYDRVQALLDRDIHIEGCDSNIIPLKAEETFHRAFYHHEFEVSELSLSSYMLALSRGSSQYHAVPIFLSRVFRHSAIYIRSDRGIHHPSDLKGKTVGVPEYQMTAALWVRGMLSDEYGVRAQDISWRTGGLQKPGREEKIRLDLREDLEVHPIPRDKTLEKLLETGEIDALVTPRVPSCFLSGSAPVTRLFPDYRSAEQSYFAKSGVFPIMHVLGIRRDVLVQHPWIAASVVKAFTAAKARSMHRLLEIGTLQVTLPWVTAEVEATRSLMGDDYWPYGVEPNRKALLAATRYSYEQGLCSKPLSVDELFVPSSTTDYIL